MQAKKDKDRQQPLLSVDAEKNEWTLRPDLLSVIDRAVTDSLPASRDEGKPLEGLAVRNAQVDLSDPPPYACLSLSLSCRYHKRVGAVPHKKAFINISFCV